MDDRITYNSISVHPRQINVYYQFLNPGRPAGTTGIRPPQFDNNAHKGKISPTAYKKITRAIDYLVYMAQPKKLPHTYHGKGLQFKLSFITLTLSSAQVHTDQEIKSHLLNQFLIEMQTKWKVNNYVWRAEKQVNGNLHFHIVCDKFIHWNDIRNTWNRIQQKFGYVTRYRENRLLWHREGFQFDKKLAPKWNYKSQLKAYKEGLRSDWQSPNSTDIHAIRRISKVNAYFKKYLTKQCENVEVSGRLWGCSYSLTNITGARTDLWSKLEDELKVIRECKYTRIVKEKWFTVFYIDMDYIEQMGLLHMPTLFNSYIKDNFP